MRTNERNVLVSNYIINYNKLKYYNTINCIAKRRRLDEII